MQDAASSQAQIKQGRSPAQGVSILIAGIALGWVLMMLTFWGASSHEIRQLEWLWTFFFYGVPIASILGLARIVHVRRRLYARGILHLVGFLVLVGGLLELHVWQINAFRAGNAIVEGRRLIIDRLGRSLLDYAEAHDGLLPRAQGWCDAIHEFFSPVLAEGDPQTPFNVAFNISVGGTRLADLPPTTVVLFETEGSRDVTGGQEGLKPFLDGQEFAFVLLPDGKVYKYWFKKNAVADPTTGTYKPIRWEP